MAEKIYTSLYVTALIIVAMYMVVMHQYTGELEPFNLNLSTLEVVFQLLITLLGFFAVYYFYKKTKNKKIKLWSASWVVDAQKLTALFFILVISQFSFLMITGVGRLGSESTHSFSPIFSILNIDALFTFFYFLVKEEKKVNRLFFYSSVISYIIFKMAQGWSGILLTVFFFEIHFFFKNKSIQPIKKKIVIIFLPILILAIGGKLYQYIFPYKFEIRGVIINEINYDEAVINLTNRLTFFPIAVGAHEKMQEINKIYSTDDVLLREAKGFFKPFAPRIIMENKEFRSLNNLVKLAFYSDLEEGTSTDIGFIMYYTLLFTSSFADAIITLFLSVILFFINKSIIESFEQYSGQLNFIYFLLLSKLFYTGSPEMVFSYGSIGILFILPLLFLFSVIKKQ